MFGIVGREPRTGKGRAGDTGAAVVPRAEAAAGAVLGLIPPGARCPPDIGCGAGRVTERIAEGPARSVRRLLRDHHPGLAAPRQQHQSTHPAASRDPPEGRHRLRGAARSGQYPMCAVSAPRSAASRPDSSAQSKRLTAV